MPYRWWGDPMAMFNEMRRMQQAVARTSEAQRPYAGVYPAVNIYDDGESFMIRAELPGIDKSKLEITTKANRVSLRGERVRNTPGQEVAYHRRERDMGVFHRVITLPEQVDSTKTTASYKNGVLEIHCPRSEAAKAHRVEIA
jgi:HSP20 family protein